VPDLEFRHVVVVPAGHAQPAHDEHGEVQGVESDEDEHPRDEEGAVAEHPAEHLGEPVEQGGEDGDAHTAEHHIVEVGHHEVGVVDVNVRGQRAHDEAGESADREEEDERQREEHGRRHLDGPLVERGHPVEHLDAARDRDDEGEQGEDPAGGVADAAGEHVVAPDQVADEGDGQAGEGDGLVAEDLLLGEGGEDLRDDAHGRQDHDVDGRMRVDPEQVLVQERVAALGRIEQADAEQPLQEDQQHRDPQDGRGQDLDPGRGVERPNEQRHAEPAHAGRAQPVDGGDEVEAGEDRREAHHEDGQHRQRHVGAGAQAERHVERPAGVGHAAAREQRQQRHDGADRVQPPGGQVQAGEGHVLGPDLDGQKEVAEHGRDAGDDEEEDHDHPVEGEQGVVRVGLHDGRARQQQLEAHEQADAERHEEEAQDQDHVQNADPLVVGGENPAQDARAAAADLEIAGQGAGVRVTVRHRATSPSGVFSR